MPKSKVTAAVVADRAGVSKWTVIRAFQKDRSIAPKTRDRVLTVAKELGYQPNLLARSLATNQTHQVAVLIDDFSNPFMMPALGYLTARLQDAGLLAVLLNINDNLSHRGAIRNARQRRLDAIVSFGVSFSPKSVIEEMSMTHGAPIFVLARESTSESLPSVYADPASAIAEMVSYLYDRGYRRPIFFGGPKPTSTALGRRRRYNENWARNGIAELQEISAERYDLQAASSVMREYFLKHPKGTHDLILCENDVLAVAAVDVARHEFGIAVPEDIAIVGFDDISLASAKAYELTTIRQPYREMIDELVAMIVGDRSISNVAIPGELVVRGTT